MTDIPSKIADKIRAELVCCDIYGRVWGGVDMEDDAQVEAGHDRFRELNRDIERHSLCFWGEAAAQLAETYEEWSDG